VIQQCQASQRNQEEIIPPVMISSIMVAKHTSFWMYCEGMLATVMPKTHAVCSGRLGCQGAFDNRLLLSLLVAGDALQMVHLERIRIFHTGQSLWRHVELSQ